VSDRPKGRGSAFRGEQRFSILAPEAGKAQPAHSPRSFGVILLDEEGHNCADADAVRSEALATSGAMLKELSGTAEFWSGEEWMMWVTDEPKGKGKVILKLEFRSIPGTGFQHKGSYQCPRRRGASPRLKRAIHRGPSQTSMVGCRLRNSRPSAFAAWSSFACRS
jgi:hypothetical protein